MSEVSLMAALIEGFRNRKGDCRGADIFWAWNRLTEMVKSVPEEGWATLLELIDNVQDSGAALENIGAGPLEDLLRSNGEKYLEPVLKAAETNPAVREALLHVWTTRFQPAAAARLEEWLRTQEGTTDD